MQSLTVDRHMFRIAVLALLVYGSCFALILSESVRYPGFLDLEGDILQSIIHVARFENPYQPLSAHYIPPPYLPLYYIVSAPLYHQFGDSFMGPRLVSGVADLIAVVLVGWMAWSESGKKAWVALVASVLFCASYRIFDGVLLNVSPDPLLLALILGAQACLGYGRRRSADAGGIALLVLAFWTKQQGALFAGWVLVYALFWRKQRRLELAFVALFVGLGPAAYLAVAWLHDGWFWFYTFLLPLSWDTSIFLSVRRTAFVVATFVPFAVLLTLAYAFRSHHLGRLRHSPSLFFVASSFATAAYTMMASGSSNNHYLPFIAGLCVTSALGMQAVAAQINFRFLLWTTGCATVASALVVAVATSSGFGSRAPMFAPYVLVLALCSIALSALIDRHRVGGAQLVPAVTLLIGQLAVSSFDPRRFLPDRDLDAVLPRFQAMLRALDGEVAWTGRGYAPRALTGRPMVPLASWVSLEDIARQSRAADRAANQTALLTLGMRDLKIDYLLSEERLVPRPGAPFGIDDYELARDFGNEFQAIRQIGYHWFTGGEYPRFLYRHRSLASPGQAGPN